MLECRVEIHTSCTQCCGAHQVSAAGTTMYSGTNLSTRTSYETCDIKGNGQGALFLSVVNMPLHSWVHHQTPAGESILFREWAEPCGDPGVASGSPGGACFRGRGGAWPAELPCAGFSSPTCCGRAGLGRALCCSGRRWLSGGAGECGSGRKARIPACRCTTASRARRSR